MQEPTTPLPPLAEQWRIVARIEGLAAKIAEAHSLRHQAVEEAEAFFRSAASTTLGALSTDGTLSDVLLEKPSNGWSALLRGGRWALEQRL
jgi:type I restriction enzyme, S subunit